MEASEGKGRLSAAGEEVTHPKGDQSALGCQLLLRMSLRLVTIRRQ